MGKKRRGSRTPRAAVKVDRKSSPKRAVSIVRPGTQAPTVSSVVLWRAIQQSQLSFEPEAQAVLDGLMEVGETRFTEVAREEAKKAGARADVVPDEVLQRLHGRAEQSAQTLVQAFAIKAGTSSRVSVTALHLAQDLTFCTVWPWCAKY